MAKGILMVSENFFFITFWILCTVQWYIEWYFKLPLRVPLSPVEISLNGPMALSDTEWYSMVISGMPLALFCKGYNNKLCFHGG